MKPKPNACGIVCEYNPFHYGHKHHIEESKKISHADVLICVMSGDFVQRGEPAIVSKWERAKEAVLQGVDLVLELPFIYATQSANYFAKGAMDVLKLCEVQSVVFGSESNNIEALISLANNQVQLDSHRDLRLSSSVRYAQLYGHLNANDILGLNYIKQLNNSSIKTYTIQRTNNYHQQTLDGTISSATAIRNAIKKQQPYKHATPMLTIKDPMYMDTYYPLIRHQLLTTKPKDLKCFFLMDEGIEHLLIKQAKKQTTYPDFLEACCSKRYTKSKIQRTLLHMLLQTLKQEVDQLPPIHYIQPLAFNAKGKAYLASLREDVLLASKLSQIPQPYRDMQEKASILYALNQKLPSPPFQQNIPFYLKSKD